MRAIQAVGAIAVLIAAGVYFNFGTLSPCGVLRETVRQRDGLAAILPDSVVDLAMTGQYGALSPGRCLSLLLEQQSAPMPVQISRQPAPPQAPTAQDAIQLAFKQTSQAIDECRTKRLSGALQTYAASVQCSNPRMLQAFNAAHYRYMDLIELYAAKRLELAGKIDRNELTEDQAKVEGEKVFAGIKETERRRDNGAK